jgi:Tol biopolymer transport system component
MTINGKDNQEPSPRFRNLRRRGMPWAPAVSPDGKKVLWVSFFQHDGSEMSIHHRIYLAELESGVSSPPAARALTRADEDSYDPQFLPGGDSISFLSAHADSETQVYVLSVLGGDEIAATNSAIPVLEHAWARNGSLLYVCDKKRRKVVTFGCSGAENVSERVTRLETRRPSMRTLWMILPGGQPFALTQADFIEQIAISHDGRRAVFRSANRTGIIPAFDLYSVDLVSHEVTRLTDRIGDESSPQFSFDDRTIYFLAPGETDSTYQSFWIYSVPSNGGESNGGDLNGGDVQLVTRDPKESILEFETCADADLLFATAENRFFTFTGESNRMLLRIDPGKGESQKLLDVSGIQDLAVHRSGESVFFRYYDVPEGSEIGAWMASGDEIVRITDLNDPLTTASVKIAK